MATAGVGTKYFRFRFIDVTDDDQSRRCWAPAVLRQLIVAAAAAAAVAIGNDEQRPLSPDIRSRDDDGGGADIAASNSATSETIVYMADKVQVSILNRSGYMSLHRVLIHVLAPDLLTTYGATSCKYPSSGRGAFTRWQLLLRCCYWFC